MNAIRKTPLETYFIYLGNMGLNNMFFINHVLIIKYLPQWDKGSEISCLMWNLKVHYLMHKNQLLYPVIIWLNPVETLLFSKMLGSIILLPVPSFSK
jgi:hypothetical protein